MLIDLKQALNTAADLVDAFNEDFLSDTGCERMAQQIFHMLRMCADAEAQGILVQERAESRFYFDGVLSKEKKAVIEKELAETAEDITGEVLDSAVGAHGKIFIVEGLRPVCLLIYIEISPGWTPEAISCVSQVCRIVSRQLETAVKQSEASRQQRELKMTQAHMLSVTERLSEYNSVLNILHSTMDITEAFSIAAREYKRIYKCDRITINQSIDELSPIRMLISRPGKLVEFDQFALAGIVELSPETQKAYICGLYVAGALQGYLLIEFYKKHSFDAAEKTLVLSSAKIIEDLIIRKNLELQRLSLAESLEKKVEERAGELREMTERAESARAAAEEAAYAKEMFLANVSHEIRTPLNVILGMTDLLSAEGLKNRQRQYVSDIQKAAESLLEMISDVLDLSKIDAGKLNISAAHFDFGLLIADIDSIMTFCAKSKGLEFKHDIRLREPEYIYGDEMRIKQIIVNLLTNAIKFTENGYVKLVVYIRDEVIRIEVSDTGLGIEEKELHSLLAAEAPGGTARGSGIGLQIAKSLANLMGGSMSASSAYGQGTVFSVSLPYVKGDASLVPKSEGAFKYLSAPTAKVLVVDDMQTNLSVASGILGLCEIVADLAISGPDALDYIAKNDYDIVFMDHMMPGMDGIETTRRIRGMAGCEHLPIIALTANAINTSKELLLNSGMNDFLSKPIEKARLMSVLRRWLPAEKVKTPFKPYEQAQEAYSPALRAAAEIEGLDIRLALSRIDNMQDVLEDGLRLVANTTASELKKLDGFLGGGDLQSFAILVHGLKGAMANIGATRLYEMAGSLEIAAKAGNVLFCQKKFPEMSEAATEFAEELKPIFTKHHEASSLSGTKEALAVGVTRLLALLEEFELEQSAECIADLEKYTFGHEADEILAQAKDLMESFDYDRAAEVLRRCLDDHC